MRSTCVLLALLPRLAFGAEDQIAPDLSESNTPAPEQQAQPKPQQIERNSPKPAPPSRRRLALAGPSPRVVVTFESTDPGVRDAAPRVEQELVAALARDGRLQPVALGAEEPAPAQEDLAEAKQHAEAAKTAYDALDLDAATREYAEAIKATLAHPLAVEPQQVAQLFAFLGASYQLNGDQPHADAAYRFALAICPGFEPDSESFSPDLRSAIAAQKAALEAGLAQGNTTLDVEAEGAAGAQVSVDGEARGAAPLRGLKLYPGRHVVVLRAPGYQPAGQVVNLPAGEQGSAKLALEETPAHRRFAGARARAHANANLPAPGPGVLELAQASGARLVAVGSLASSPAGAKLSVVLFDVQAQRRLAGLSRDTLVESTRFPAVMDDLAVELANDVAEPPGDAVAEESGPAQPLTQRWYFWAGAGTAAAALVAGGIAAGLALAPSDGRPPPGVGQTLGLHSL